MTIQNSLQRSSPESQGLSSAAVLAFVAAVEQNLVDMHSFMLMRHGQVVAEGWWGPYAAERPHMLFSLSKSFTSTAVGMAVAEGRLSVDDPVLSFFPEEAPARVSKNLAAMRVRHLLSMSTGHAKDATPGARTQKEGNWARGFLAQAVRHAPGTHFIYNSAATYMLSAIVQKLTGMTLLDYLGPRLFEPLGIIDPTWESCPRGINVGGWGLSIKTEDIARFGQMYLQQGVWNGQRLLPAEWVAEASARQVSNGSKPESDWEQGYGYQFWRCRHGAYRGDGAFGQYCVVMPEQDAVLAITSGLGEMQAPLNLVWQHLLPTMGPQPLPADGAAQAQLAQKLAALALPPLSGVPVPPTAARVQGQCFDLAANRQGVQSITFDFFAQGCSFAMANAQGTATVNAGYGVWQPGNAFFPGLGMQRCVASAAWTAPDTLLLSQRFIETPFEYKLTCQFGRSRVTLAPTLNVSFGPTKLPVLRGKLA